MLDYAIIFFSFQQFKHENKTHELDSITTVTLNRTTIAKTYTSNLGNLIWENQQEIKDCAILFMNPIYAQNGRVDEAYKLFEKMPERNLVSWTAMITGYAQDGHVDEALSSLHVLSLLHVESIRI